MGENTVVGSLLKWNPVTGMAYRGAQGVGAIGGPNTKSPQEQFAEGQAGRYDALEGQAKNYFDPEMINRYFNTSAGNLMQRGETARGQAMGAAGGQAGSRGLLNPSAFINQQGAQAYNPFVNALQGLEGQRGQALVNNQGDLFKALLSIQQGRQGLSSSYDPSSEKDKQMALLNGFISGGGKAASYLG